MVSTPRLKGKLAERGLSIADVATAMNINASTLYRKLSKPDRRLSLHDVNEITRHLNLTKEEANAIFFSDDVVNTRRNDTPPTQKGG